jgi:sulfite reductase (NADPH) flavoprotein alpha-component
MVGPGTGIAPFRAFLQQRILEGAKGRHWLIFGEQHRATDFLYGEEFLEMQRLGQLKRLDTAFSRDQAHKVYVQHRLLENGKELWAWLSNGAYFYVCGDAKRMAKDVHQALIQIAQQEGGMSPEAASEHINVTLMRTEHRYLRDVY